MSKISELSDGGSLISSDYLIAVRSGGNVKVRMNQINVDQVDLGDNEFIRLGNSQDLTMVHTSTQSIINQAGIGDLLIQRAGATKLTINASGIDVTGGVTADGVQSTDGDIKVTTSGSFVGFNSQRAGVPNIGGYQLGRLNFDAYSTGTTFVSGASIQSYSDGAAWTSSSTPAYLSFQTTPSGSTSLSERLRIDSSGKLTYGGISYGVAVDPDGAGGFGAGYNFETNAGSPRHLVTGPVSGQYLSSGSLPFVAWYTGASAGAGTAAPERMRIDASGNLLVGKTAADGGVNGGEIRSNGEAYLTATSTPLSINRKSTDGALLNFAKDGVPVGSIGTQGGDINIGTGACGISFVDGVPAFYPWTITGNTTRDAAIDLGDSGARFKDLYLSGGVVFGATGGAVTSKTLDDYEEGTWVPTVATGTISTLNSWYTKVGDVVTVGGLIYNFSDRTSATQVIINNLPFTSSATVSVGSVFFRHVNTTADQVSMYTPASSTNIQFWGSSFAGTYTAINHSQLNSADARIFFSVTYQAT